MTGIAPQLLVKQPPPPTVTSLARTVPDAEPISDTRARTVLVRLSKTGLGY
ncbi:hypothetical protein E2C01_087162 [Portunus trituberculatus]|uniref:Uncharacterized protein n=1 Tax=Portunus trituberculatus TaxID=210409 RepID=A0A5B7J5V6_PORTR|nr:hypothetical protein [Portunus trituberculatus]